MISYKIVFSYGFIFGIFPYSVNKIKSGFTLSISYLGLTSTLVSSLLITIKLINFNGKLEGKSGYSYIALIFYYIFLWHLFVLCCKTIFYFKSIKQYFEYFMNLTQRSVCSDFNKLNMIIAVKFICALIKASAFFKMDLLLFMENVSNIFIATMSFVDTILYIFVLSVVDHSFETIISDIRSDFGGGKLTVYKIIKHRRRVTQLNELITLTDRLFGARNIPSIVMAVLAMAACIFGLFATIIGEWIGSVEDLFVSVSSSLEFLIALVLLSNVSTKVAEKVTELTAYTTFNLICIVDICFHD